MISPSKLKFAKVNKTSDMSRERFIYRCGINPPLLIVVMFCFDVKPYNQHFTRCRHSFSIHHAFKFQNLTSQFVVLLDCKPPVIKRNRTVSFEWLPLISRYFKIVGRYQKTRHNHYYKPLSFHQTHLNLCGTL